MIRGSPLIKYTMTTTESKPFTNWRNTRLLVQLLKKYFLYYKGDRFIYSQKGYIPKIRLPQMRTGSTIGQMRLFKDKYS